MQTMLVYLELVLGPHREPDGRAMKGIYQGSPTDIRSLWSTRGIARMILLPFDSVVGSSRSATITGGYALICRRDNRMHNDISTNEDLIAGIIEDLRERPDIDPDLLGILTEYILGLDVSITAIEDTAAAIEKLASDRGNSDSNEDTYHH